LLKYGLGSLWAGQHTLYLLYDGGDKESTKKTMETSHIFHTSTKRKREIQKEGQELPDIEESPC